MLRDLLRYAISQGARGIVMHLNNLENLSDQALMHDGLHLIVVGTTDAVRTVVQSHTQIRSVFSNPLVLEPLALEDVEQLLANRYEALQLDPARPWRSPVEGAVVERLTSAGADVAPVGLGDLMLTLRQRNQAELQEQLGDTAWERLLGWAQVDSASIQTQAELVELWQVKQPSVSQTLQQLIEAGAVEALPRRGRGAIEYLMTGTARLAF